MRGKKGEPHLNPDDPPRCRANKRHGRGTYANDRPPIVGTVGRQSGQVRIRVAFDTTGNTLEAHVHQFTRSGSQLFTDENQSYNHVIRPRSTICQSNNEWARDGDGDGIREVLVNSVDGLWTDVRNFLRPFKGVYKRWLATYVAIAEFKRNLKRISPSFIYAITRPYTFIT